MIDLSKLKPHLPESVFNELPSVIKNGNCTPEQYKNRLLHFISQCAHESGNFKVVRENLNYGYEGLMSTFKFTPIQAEAYAHQPEKIANKAYENKGGNGSEQTGDGWKYRGRGYIQITLKNNYLHFGDFLFNKGIKRDIFNQPDLVATEFPLESASFYFHENNIWSICDEGNSNEVIEKVTGKINRKKLHLPERIALFRKFEQILNSGL